MLKRIRLLQVGKDNNALMHKLAVKLKSIQDVFHFDFDEDVILPDESLLQEDGSFKYGYLEQLIWEYMNPKWRDEQPIAVSMYPLQDGDIVVSTESEAVISTHNWSSYSKYTLEKGVMYMIAAELLGYYVRTEYHDETRGCPNDYCDDVSDIDIGLERCEFCGVCRNIIWADIEAGKISTREASAIYRILDNIADRRIVSCIMPFNESMNPIFAAVQRTVEANGFQCRRADLIYDAASIMNTVYDLLYRSEFVIADLSGQNPNVLYELGYAHALGRNSVLIAQKLEEIPFDLRHRKIVIYEPDRLDITLEKVLSMYLA